MRRLARGFTLIEILVAILIIAIMMSAAMLSFNTSSGDQTIRDEARRFMALVQLAQDDAIMQGRDFGLDFAVSGYRFVEYDPFTTQWAETLNDNYLQYWTLPEGIEFELYLEDQRVLLDQQLEVIEYNDASDQPDDSYTPQLLIFSSGDSTPFELHILNTEIDLRVGIQGDLLGNLELMSNEDFEY